MTDKKLQLTPKKTEAIVFSGKRRIAPIVFRVNGVEVYTQDRLKYLWIVLDKSLYFNKHIEGMAEKAQKLTTAVTRLMPHHGGPRASPRKVLASVANSIMLYGAPVWAAALQVQQYKNKYIKIQRQLALRLSGAYRTVSTEVALVISGTIPVDLLAKERAQIYIAKTLKTGTTQ